jgi:hypothetical protein
MEPVIMAEEQNKTKKKREEDSARCNLTDTGWNSNCIWKRNSEPEDDSNILLVLK